MRPHRFARCLPGCCLSLAASLLLAACSADHTAGPEQGPVAAGPLRELPEAVLPPLPVDSLAVRSASNTAGSDFYASSVNTVIEGNSIILQSTENEAAYVIYRINPYQDFLHALSLAGDYANAGERVYFAAANYGTGRWGFSELVGERFELDPYTNRSPLGNYYFAVFAVDGAEIQLDEITHYTSSGVWKQVPLETGAPGNGYPALAMTGTGPIAAWAGRSVEVDGNDSLWFARSSTPLGLDPEDWSPLEADQGTAEPEAVPYVGTYASLAIIDGRPAVSYHDELNGNLKYSISSTADGADPADWQSIVVEVGGQMGEWTGRWTSLAVVDGVPAIAYHDVGDGALKYALSSTADGAAAGDWSILSLEAGEAGLYASLAVVDGRPAIAAYEDTTKQLHYYWSSSARGSAGGDWSHVTVEADSGHIGRFCSLAEVDGRPAISSFEIDNFDLAYSICDKTDGIAPQDWHSIIVDSDRNCGQWTSLAVIQGRPAIAYYEALNGHLRFAWSNSADGALVEDWSAGTAGVFDRPGWGNSLVDNNGLPAILTYQQLEGGILYFLRIAEGLPQK